MPVVAPSSDEPPKPVNREAVKVLAMAVGVREAARRMGLEEHRVLKWSQRDKAGPWTLSPEHKQISTPSITGATLQVSSCPQPVVKADKAMADVMAEYEGKTKIALAKAALKGSEACAELEGAEILTESSNLKNLAGVAQITHGWKDGSSGTVLSIGLLVQS